MKAVLHTDGGARGNPGPAGIGYVLAIKDGETIEHAEYVGELTNNQAEYIALQRGLERAAQAGITDLEVLMDSELIVKQLSGAYRVKHADLKPLHAAVRALLDAFHHVSVQHVRREKNAEADRLVNKAIDAIVGKGK